LLDYKSTYTFVYVPLASELLDDVAACFYALAVMVKRGLDQLKCRWVYFRTDDQLPEDSRKVDFTITREHAIEVLAPYEAKALRLREIMRYELQDRKKLYPGNKVITLKPEMDATSCGDFGGCVYHHEHGGPCRPPKATPGQIAAKLIRTTDLLRKRREAQKALRGVQSERARATPRRGAETKRRVGNDTRKREAPTPSHSAHHVTEESTTHIMGRFSDARKNAAAGGAAATEPEAAASGNAEAAPAATPRTRAPRAPNKAAAPAGDALGLTLQVTNGPSIPLPAGSKLHDLASRLVDVLYPAD